MPLPALTPLEIASGVVLGPRHGDPVPVTFEGAPPPRQALEDILVPALSRTPCVVAFSGGRDSSAVLALATWVARKHGLELPIPVTFRAPQHPRTVETEWQELVVRHLGLTEWDTFDVDSHLDVIGDAAVRILRRHGVFWPSNAATMAWFVDRARGGSVLTGNGGDEMLAEWSAQRVAALRRGRAVPHSRGEVRWLGLSYLPGPLRAKAIARRAPRLPWLTERGVRELQAVRGAAIASWSRTWGAQVDALINSRFRELSSGVLQAIAEDGDALLVEPLFDPRFGASLVAHGPRHGYDSRSAAMRSLFEDVLPPQSVTRESKAVFTELFFGETARAFARHWDGTGVDDRYTDADGLRAAWAKDGVDFRTLTALQAAWLASDGQARSVAASIAPTAS